MRQQASQKNNTIFETMSTLSTPINIASTCCIIYQHCHLQLEAVLRASLSLPAMSTQSTQGNMRQQASQKNSTFYEPMATLSTPINIASTCCIIYQHSHLQLEAVLRASLSLPATSTQSTQGNICNMRPQASQKTAPFLKPCQHCQHTSTCLLYTSPSPRDATLSRMPSSA